MNIHSIYRIFFRIFRTRRMRIFAQRFGITRETRVLDVGGAWYNWSLLEEQPRLTIINIQRMAESQEGVDYLVGDGCLLPFADKEFDIVYSNSVIEHLGTRENQMRFAAECRRVGRRYYIQTPNRGFPIEPHYLAPFVHWLPPGLQRRLIRRFTLRGLLTKPSQATIDSLVKEIRLLDQREFAELFPGSELWRERVLGLTKSLMAVGEAP